MYANVISACIRTVLCVLNMFQAFLFVFECIWREGISLCLMGFSNYQNYNNAKPSGIKIIAILTRYINTIWIANGSQTKGVHLRIYRVSQTISV